MSELKILHNPRCSKSRQTLQLLEDKGLSPEIVEYLNNPLNQKQLSEIIQQLDLDSARSLMRKGESEYKAQNLADSTLSETQLIQAMVTTPKLIERPIVLFNGKAAIGRPPEAVLDIL